MNLIAEVTHALSSRDTSIPAPHVTKHGRFSDPVPDIKHAYDIYLALDGSGDHFPDAKGWSQAKQTDTPNPRFYFFQVLVLMMETHSFGSMRPIDLLQNDPGKYWLAVALTVFQLCEPKPSLARVLDTMMHSDNMFDVAFLEHVVAAKNDYEPFIRENKPKRGGGRKPAAAPDIAIQVAPMDWSVYSHVRMDSERCITEGLAECENAWWSVANRPVELAPAAPNNDEKGIKFTDFAKFLATKNVGIDKTRRIYPKCTFTVTPVPDINERIIGLYVRFLIRDPDMNPGKFYERMIANVQLRAKRAGKKFYGDNGEMFPAYGRFLDTYHPSGNYTSHETYVNAALRLKPSLKQSDRFQTFKELTIGDYSSKLHLSSLLTSDQAILDMKNAKRTFQTFVWWKDRTAYFPPHYDTYMYHPDGVFWYSAQNIGFYSQWFPHVESNANLLTEILAGSNLDRFANPDPFAMQEDEDENQGPVSIHKETARFLEDNWIVPKTKIAATTLVGYTTYNEFVHSAAEAGVCFERLFREYPLHAELTMKHVAALGADWRTHLVNNAHVSHVLMTKAPYATVLKLEYGDAPTYQALLKLAGADQPLVDRVAQYERYSILFNKAQEAFNERFVALWQVDGNVDALPIPPTIITILNWYKSNRSRLPHMTRQFVLFDKNMGIFGNSSFKMVQSMSDTGQLLQPMLTLMVEALFSAYRWSPGVLATNLMIGGAMGSGKSLHCINFPRNSFFIPNTTTSFTTETKAASTTARHVYDEIHLMDETPEWVVNKHESKKNPDLVNQEKVKLSDRRLGKRCYVNVTLEDGTTVRWSQLTETDHYAAKLTITNSLMDEKTALLSRFHQMIMTPTDETAAKLTGTDVSPIKEPVEFASCIAHFLNVAVYKCIQTGAMLEPNMQMWNDICTRVKDALTADNSVPQGFFDRKLEIMKTYAIQCVIRKAIHCAYDIPGGENYERPFSAAEVRMVQPYLYCTVEIVIWVWTALVSGFIEEQFSITLLAVLQSIGFDNVHDDSDPYDYYERDINNEIPWREHVNNNANPDANDGNDILVNINYITLEGSMEQICRQIATHTRMDANDVEGCLKRMSKIMLEVPGCAYVPQEKGSFAAYHKYINNDFTIKNTDGSRQNIPRKYMRSDGRADVFCSKHEVPRYEKGRRLPVVDFSDYAATKKIHIMPFVSGFFRRKIVVDALERAVMHANLKEGKYLIGIPSDNISMQLQTTEFKSLTIETLVAQADQRLNWSRDGQWLGDPSIPFESRPIPLSIGIGIERRGAISKAASEIYTTAPLVPTRPEDRKKTMEDTERAMANMRCARYIYTDLDAQSAMQQHLRIGRPLDEVVRTPKFVLDRMRAECERQGLPYSGKADYPQSYMDSYNENMQKWTATSASLAALEEARRAMAGNAPERRGPAPRTRTYIRPASATTKPARKNVAKKRTRTAAASVIDKL